MNFNAIFTMASDVLHDLPEFEQSVQTAITIIAALEQGQLPALTTDQLAQFKTDITDLETIITDIKAL